ncbi:DUF2252 domain-containing protein [Alloyangia pacifica]|uniref:Uncharacterized conserved protein, DUF2252 family n=1 Tax=Alloyangia pacifica TaxID=311180 RepID=A0A1I6W929_9RHOB|nr:DUF2252 family protein [Alloyangia pacifica]SDI45968.1 Uncharacterized conserved protein, DUF2252 family [Alloyangia pacifica]SFT22499.1 Uncharacterized conserved protein, DUF2252 family [Alloyangia pacifica]
MSTSPKSRPRKTAEPETAQEGAEPGSGAAEPVGEMRRRTEEYARLARRADDEALVFRPRDLTGQARRLHVRSTIIEDHQVRIDQKAAGAEEKFSVLSDSFFSFFRGTSLLFHRDMAGEDARMPTVLCLGDVHPGNFGVMPNADNVPIFGVNDFDDVIYGPFVWDLKRGAVGFMIAAEEEGGYGRKKQRKIARKFLHGYRDGMAFFAEHNTELNVEMREDNCPKIIRPLFKKVRRSREDWLKGRYLEETGRGFRANDELTPVSSRVEEFQKLVKALAGQNGIKAGGRHGPLKVKDVAMRHGQGTASLGLPRYYVLLEGPSENATDDIIIEFKKARRSALEGLVPAHDFDAGDQGDRIAHGQSVHLAQGDVFYGNVEIEGESFMSRERAPFRNDADLDDFSKKEWKRYAFACGRALAQAHARSDDLGQLDYDIEPAILQAMEPAELFFDDILCFAEEAVLRLREDHAMFRRDLELGAFEVTEKRYR